eukprot:SAG25_NODE_6388_length_564_cov_0.881720_1_plen_122_part_10
MVCRVSRNPCCRAALVLVPTIFYILHVQLREKNELMAARYAESLVHKDEDSLVREIIKLQGELDLMKQHAGEHADTKVAASARGEPAVMKSNAARTEAAAAAVVEAASAEPPPSPPAAPSAP